MVSSIYVVRQLPHSPIMHEHNDFDEMQKGKMMEAKPHPIVHSILRAFSEFPS